MYSIRANRTLNASLFVFIQHERELAMPPLVCIKFETCVLCSQESPNPSPLTYITFAFNANNLLTNI